MGTMSENWKEDTIDATVGAAEQLSPSNPIELTYEIPKVDYRLGIMARATYGKHRKEMRLEATAWTVGYIRRATPAYLLPPLPHLTSIYLKLTRFHYVIEASL